MCVRVCACARVRVSACARVSVCACKSENVCCFIKAGGTQPVCKSSESREGPLLIAELLVHCLELAILGCKQLLCDLHLDNNNNNNNKR